MKKINILFLVVILFASCSSGNQNSIIDNDSNIYLSDTTSIDQNTSNSDSIIEIRDEGKWDENLIQYMHLYLNNTIPCLKDFSNYEVKYDYINQSNIPYINIYKKGENNYLSLYQRILVDNNYQLISRDIDENDSSYVWYNYKKDSLVIRFSYYKNESNDYYFDLYTYDDEFNSKKCLPNNYLVRINPDDIAPNKTPYLEVSKEIQLSSYTFSIDYVTNMDNLIQLRKGNYDGLKNVTPLINAKYLYLEGLLNYGYSYYINVRAGNSSNDMKLLSSLTDVYDISSYSYIQISSTGKGLIKLDSIQIY